MSTETPDVTTLSRRVEALERRTTLLLVLLVAELLTCAVAIALPFLRGPGGGAPTTVAATQFELQDPSGHAFAVIGKPPDSGPGLFVRDRMGSHRIALNLADLDTPVLSLNDATGAPRVLMGVDARGNGAIEVRDASGSTTWRSH
jgi:hypothetical protein